MPRRTLFIDLAGTLILRDPESRRWGAWTGVAGLLGDLAAHHDLHLTTGDSQSGARAALADLEVTDLFSGVHSELPGGGKPFGALARALGVVPARCLVLGDDPINDTARDSDEIVSLIMFHETRQIPTAQVREVMGMLADAGDDVLSGFKALVSDEAPVVTGSLDPARLSPSPLGDHCRLGWWLKHGDARRPVITLTA